MHLYVIYPVGKHDIIEESILSLEYDVITNGNEVERDILEAMNIEENETFDDVNLNKDGPLGAKVNVNLGGTTDEVHYNQQNLNLEVTSDGVDCNQEDVEVDGTTYGVDCNQEVMEVEGTTDGVYYSQADMEGPNCNVGEVERVN